jgi:DNA-binding NarL/FixJ family response regulator
VIKVAAVDEHDLMLAGVRSLMEASGGRTSFVGGAHTVPELLVRHLDIDVVLLDLRLDDRSQPEDNVAALRDADARVLIYSDGFATDLLRRACRTQAMGVVLKNEPPMLLIEAIETAARSEFWPSATWASAIDADTDLPWARLTDRQLQVLRLYASGYTSQQVAARLGVGDASVKTVVGRIRERYESLGRTASSRAELRQRAIEDGYIAPVEGEE